jgi:hypothetical protein
MTLSYKVTPATNPQFAAHPGKSRDYWFGFAESSRVVGLPRQGIAIVKKSWGWVAKLP